MIKTMAGILEMFPDIKKEDWNKGLPLGSWIHNTAMVGNWTNFGLQTIIGPDVVIGSNVAVGDDVTFWTGVRIGDNVIIENRCSFRDRVEISCGYHIWEGSKISRRNERFETLSTSGSQS